MISIIIPIYKAEPFLSLCVDSIIAQTYHDWELLLIDDGSPDNSGDICDEYAAKDIRIKVFHKPNGGVSSARNLGLDKAQGDWITFVDADDYIGENYLNAIEGCKSDLLVLQSYTFTEKGVMGIKSSLPKRVSTNKESFCSIVSNILPDVIMKTPWGKFFRRDIVANSRFPQGMKTGEDTIFVLQTLRRCSSIEVKNGFYYYWRIPKSSDAIKYKMPFDTVIKYLSMIDEEYQSLGIKSSKYEQSILLHFFSLFDKRKPLNIQKWFNSEVVKCITVSAFDNFTLPISYSNWEKHIYRTWVLHHLKNFARKIKSLFK